MRVQVGVVEAEVVADLVQHGLADLLDHLRTGGAYPLVRALENSDYVRHHTAVGRGSPRDGDSFVQSQQFAARVAHRAQLPLVRLLRHGDPHILQHLLEPVGNTRERVFDGPLEFVVAHLHVADFSSCLTGLHLSLRPIFSSHWRNPLPDESAAAGQHHESPSSGLPRNPQSRDHNSLITVRAKHCRQPILEQ